MQVDQIENDQELLKIKQKQFSCKDYYRKKDFDLKNEVNKERCIRDFFKEKYLRETAYLNENKLRCFLDEAINYN